MRPDFSGEYVLDRSASVLRAGAVASAIALAVAAASCHRVSTSSTQECLAKRFGMASVEFAAATTISDRYGDTQLGGAVVRVVQGTSDRPALEGAQVFFVTAAIGADSGKQVKRGTTGAAGVIMLDSLVAGRYEVRIRRLGSVRASQHLAVRRRFIDTLIVALQGEAVCLVEQRETPDHR